MPPPNTHTHTQMAVELSNELCRAEIYSKITLLPLCNLFRQRVLLLDHWARYFFMFFILRWFLTTFGLSAQMKLPTYISLWKQYFLISCFQSGGLWIDLFSLWFQTWHIFIYVLARQKSIVSYHLGYVSRRTVSI